MAINTPVYSIIYDKSLASDPEACLTYAGLCEGFTPMCNAGDSNCDEGSWAEGNGTIFDAIEVGYLNNSTWTKFNKSSVTGSSSYDCFTRIPKVYQKVTDISDAKDNSKVQLDLSLEPFNGASLHPSFVRSGTELNHLYIGRYLGDEYVADSLYSISGQMPTTNFYRHMFRDCARDRGTSYSLLKYYDWDLVNKLYLLAFKNFDSQTALGPGNTHSFSVINTGGTDGKSWMCSTSMTGSGSMCFLGIEDWWGNCSQVLDDFYGTGGSYYVGNNTTPTDDTSNKTLLISGFTEYTVGYPLTCKATADGFFLAETYGGSSTKGLCDYHYYNNSENIACVGLESYSNTGSGAFFLGASMGLTYSDGFIGARLTYVD